MTLPHADVPAELWPRRPGWPAARRLLYRLAAAAAYLFKRAGRG